MKFKLLILALLFRVVGYTQQYPFINFSTEEGLPQSQVTSFVQDSVGYLWVGTLGGLARFNGAEFKIFSTDDGLLNNRITSLSVFDGKLWIGHDGGISIISDGKISSVIYDAEYQSKNVSQILKFKDKVVVCSNGGGLFVLDDKRLVPLGLKGKEDYNRVRAAIVLEGKLLVATRAGILQSENLEQFVLRPSLDTLSYADIDIGRNSIYYTTFSNQILIENIETRKITRSAYHNPNIKFLNTFVDNESNVWLSTHDGVVVLKNDGNYIKLDNHNGLPINTINCIYQGWDNNIWIGSLGKGFFRFPGETFRFYDLNSGLPSNIYLCGFQEKNGDYLLGTYDRGIVRIRKDGSSEIEFNGFPLFWSSIANVDNKDWFGAQQGLVYHTSDDRFVQWKDMSGLPGEKITAFYKINDYSMYVGGHRGVSIYEHGKFRRLGVNNNDIGTIRDFEILNDTLFCASHFGVFKFVNNRYELLKGGEQVIYSIEKDDNNNLWIGAEEGLFKYTNGKIERIRLRDDPASNFINFLAYKNNSLYVGTNNGLFVINNLKQENLIIKRFGKGEGILDPETNLNSCFFDAKGNLWFGTASGLVVYEVSNKQDDGANPVVNFTNIKLNYEDFDYSKYSDNLLSSGFPLSLNLPHSKNNIMFELDGISLVYHKGLKYQFMLEGLNESWSPESEASIISFTSLPSGNYNLIVRAIDVDGRVSNPISFPFVVNSPYYATWWFILLMIVLGVLLFVLVFRMREMRVKESREKERLEYKTKLLALEQKSINASMNRHFIFNALNSIQYFINTQDKLSANKYLTNFAKLIRKNLDSANNEENVVTIEEEIERIQLYLSLEAMRFHNRFEYSIDVAKDIDVESIEIPSMIMQPFVENSIIHGILPDERKDGKIEIKLYRKDDALVIEIKDNGIGVDKSIQKKMSLQGDHKSQGMEITSKRIELIRKISKKGISLDGPKELKDKNGLINGTVVLINIPLNDLEK